MLRIIFREIAWILLPMIGVYVLLLALSLVIYPLQKTDLLDTLEAKNSFYSTGPAYVVFASTRLASSQPSIVLIGPSSVLMGFRPDKLSSLISGIEFHNIGLGGTSIDAMAAAVELVYANRELHERKNLTFVLGLWLGEFRHNEDAKERTPIVQQMERFGLFTRTSGGFRRAMGVPAFEGMVTMLRPFFLIHGLLAKTRGEARNWQGPENRELVCNADQLAAFTKLGGGDPTEYGMSQYVALTNLAVQIKAMGGRLILIDLPQPRCFTDVSGNWRFYQERKKKYLQAAINSGATYWNFQDMNDNDRFMDATHPTPQASDEWAERFAIELKRAGIFASDDNR